MARGLTGDGALGGVQTDAGLDGTGVELLEPLPPDDILCSIIDGVSVCATGGNAGTKTSNN